MWRQRNTTGPNGRSGLSQAQSRLIGRLGSLRVRPRVAGAIIGALAVVALGTVVLPDAAHATGGVNTTDVFQLDGNIIHDGSANLAWSDLFTVGAGGVVTTNASNVGGSSPVISATLFPDYAAPDASYFTQNGAGVKDTDLIANWGCKTQNNPTAKDNILNAYAAFVQMPTDPSTTANGEAGDLVLYLGSERQSNSGTSFAGFWLFRSQVSCNAATGAFTGQHTNGDLLVVSNFTNGGSTQAVTLYSWQNGSLVQLANGGICGSSAGNMCAIANAASTVDAPWPPGNTTGNSAAPPGPFGLLPQTFVNTGIDLTKQLGGPVPCFTYFQAETRSSATLSATLKDFTSGTFSNCNPPTVNTSVDGTTPGTSTAVVGSQAFDTATLTGAAGTPKGTVTYSLWTDNKCTVAATSPLFSNSTNSDTVTLNADGTVPNSPSLTFSNTGNYWWQASYSGDVSLGGRNEAAMSVCTSEPLTITPASPTVATVPNPLSVTVGGSLGDTATLSGVVDPITGTNAASITFSLYDPSDSTCAAQNGEPVFTNTVSNTTANGSPGYATSSTYASTAAGVWHWVASYSGDTNNNSSTSTCASEAVSVKKATPAIATIPSPTSLVVGTGSFSDTANVTSGYFPAAGTSPNGTVTFKLYGPFTSAPMAGQCIDPPTTGAKLLATDSNVAANSGATQSAASYTAPSYTPTQTGIYQWVAAYNGNSNNAATTSMCADTSEQVTVTPASPSIATTPSANITIGAANTISDGATVSGGYFPGAGTSPNGTVTFKLYGPFTSAPTSQAACVDPPALTANLLATYSDVAPNSGATQILASYSSPSFTPTQIGTYQWVAAYNGNSNNNPIAGSCGDGTEQVVVGPATPPIASTVLLGDTVKVSPVAGAGTPAGTVTFSLFGPFASAGLVSCSGTPVVGTPEGPLAIDPVTGEASTPTPVAVAAGLYAWQVTFTPAVSVPPGNYAGASTSCTAEEANISYQAPSPIS